MLLKIFGYQGVKVIKLESTFFKAPYETKYRKGKAISMTPKQKAEDIAQDMFGSRYKGFVLEQNGNVICNTLENRNQAHLSGVRREGGQFGPDFAQRLRNKLK